MVWKMFIRRCRTKPCASISTEKIFPALNKLLNKADKPKTIKNFAVGHLSILTKSNGKYSDARV